MIAASVRCTSCGLVGTDIPGKGGTVIQFKHMRHGVQFHPVPVVTGEAGKGKINLKLKTGG